MRFAGSSGTRTSSVVRRLKVGSPNELIVRIRRDSYLGSCTTRNHVTRDRSNRQGTHFLVCMSLDACSPSILEPHGQYSHLALRGIYNLRQVHVNVYLS